MVKRETHKLLIYPVSGRSEDTLIPIIQRHVEPRSTIYSNGWIAYCSFNDLGYEDFTVLHKYSIKKVYVKESTGEEVEINTNWIEGAWKHDQEYLRRMSGTKISQFKGYLCKAMWRTEAKSHMYERFFGYLRAIYDFDETPIIHPPNANRSHFVRAGLHIRFLTRMGNKTW